jgi:hypothetical protein
MLCSYGTLPAGLVDYPENLDLANWLMNQNLIGTEAPGGLGIYTKYDLQMALWTLLDDPPPSSDYPDADPARVAAMVASAQANGEGFKPGAGQFCIIIINPVDAACVTNGQVSIILLKCPPKECYGGCTPGFWKNNAFHHCAVAWFCHGPYDRFYATFGISIQVLRANGRCLYANPTLLQALNANGSGINLLARSAVAALLNACNPNVNYPLTEEEIISQVQAAVAAGANAIQELGEQLDDYNNYGCSIDQHGLPKIFQRFQHR